MVATYIDSEQIRSGVDMAVGHLRHMRCGQRIRCCNLAVLTLYTLGVH